MSGDGGGNEAALDALLAQADEKIADALVELERGIDIDGARENAVIACLGGLGLETLLVHLLAILGGNGGNASDAVTATERQRVLIRRWNVEHVKNLDVTASRDGLGVHQDAVAIEQDTVYLLRTLHQYPPC